MNDLVLYNYFRSSASYRVRIALCLKNLKFEYRAVHLLKSGGEQFNQDYKKLNPSEQVPTLVHDGKAIGQSMAIVEYIDQVFPTDPLLFPKDAFARALVVQACEINNSGVQPLHNLYVLNRLEKDFGANQEQKNAWTQHFIHRGLDAYENLVRSHAKEFSFGSKPTAADCYLIPNLANAERFGVSLEKYPIIQRIQKSCAGLEAFQKAHPTQQPDAQPT